MTKKDYIMLAGLVDRVRMDFILRDPRLGITLDREFIVPLAHALNKDNPKFDYARFLAACGVKAERA